MPINRTVVYPPTVTGRINRFHLHYGGSDNTAQYNTAGAKSLNYANGASLLRAEDETIHVLPWTDKWADSVGLFGSENKFVKYNYATEGKIQLPQCFEDVGYECMLYSPQWPDTDENYQCVKWDEYFDYPDGYEYEEALFNYDIIDSDSIAKPKYYISVEIVNHGTDNIYNDDWLDVRLYGKDRVEHPYFKMYVPWGEPVYVGFHARNTRRLAYDVDIVIGKEIVPLDYVEDKRLVRRTIEFGDQH